KVLCDGVQLGGSKSLRPKTGGGSARTVRSNFRTDAWGASMDQTALVTRNWVADGRKLLEQLAQRGFDVTAAGWIKVNEDGDWRLYIVSPIVEDKGQIEAYRIIDEVLQTWSDPWLSLFDIKVVRPNSRFGGDLARIRNRLVGGVISRAQQAQLGET